MTHCLLSLDHAPHPVDTDGLSPLHLAARAGLSSVAEALLRAGAQVNAGAASSQSAQQTPLHFAARYKHASTAELLLKGGADVNASESMPCTDREASVGYTALHWAAENGDTSMVRLLLSFDADLNRQASF
ncbi:hypothetical protein CAPTEDRAFT_120907, partial [Capitella teleta]